jgi:hypothetical protein
MATITFSPSSLPHRDTDEQINNEIHNQGHNSANSIIPNYENRTIRINSYDRANNPTNSNKYPKLLINSLVRKWRDIFNEYLRQNKTARRIDALLDSLHFQSHHGVKFEHTHLIYDRSTKAFEIQCSATPDQDVLCFPTEEMSSFFIHGHSKSLRKVFVELFNKVNNLRFCSSCGQFAFESSYHEELDMCEHCVFEELSASQRKETKLCPICQEDMKRWYTTRCGHHFHRKCLARMDPTNELRCPLCRKWLCEDDECFDDYGDDN